MKYLIVVPDGAADEPRAELGGKTPLEAAEIEHMDALAGTGAVGLVRTIPCGVEPGSDAANLSILGYDPAVYLTGRSALEAASIGIHLEESNITYRANLVTLTGEGAYEALTIADHSAGDIETEEADELIQAVNRAFSDDLIRFYTGVSYRHCMVLREGSTEHRLTPPHDVLGQKVGDWLPKGADGATIEALMRKSYPLLNDHPVNQKRRQRGLRPANSLWIWGQGRRAALPSFYERYGLSGAVISAVDLIKGIGICAGLERIEVPGATGTLDTNYEGKADAAIRAFAEGKDFVFIHLEGPDECSHQGDLAGKLESLARIDRRVVKPVTAYLEQSGLRFRVLIAPDHRTPIRIRTHTAEPVPFVLYDSATREPFDANKRFSESSGAKGLSFDSGVALADHFFAKTQEAIE